MFLSVGKRRISAASEPAVKSDKCARSSSWNIGNARHWASCRLGGPVLLGISIDFSVRLLSLCFTFALLAVELLSATFVCLSYVSWSSCAAAYFAFFSVCSCLIFPSFLSCPFCCLPFFSFLYYFPSSFLFGLIVFSFVSLPRFLFLFFLFYQSSDGPFPFSSSRAAFESASAVWLHSRYMCRTSHFTPLSVNSFPSARHVL